MIKNFIYILYILFRDNYMDGINCFLIVSIGKSLHIFVMFFIFRLNLINP